MNENVTNSVLMAICLSLVISCGSDSSETSSSKGECQDSILQGSWSGLLAGNPDTLTFGANCSGSATYCNANFTYPNVTAGTGTVSLDVSSNNGGALCLPVGENACSYSVSGNTLSYNCGGGVLQYTKS